MMMIIAAVLLLAATAVNGAEWFHFNGASFHRECIYQLSDDAVRVENLPHGYGVNIHYGNGRAVEHVPSCSRRWDATVVRVAPDFYIPWVARGVAVNEPTFGWINTTYTVPTNPAVTDDSTILIYCKCNTQSCILHVDG